GGVKDRGGGDAGTGRGSKAGRRRTGSGCGPPPAASGASSPCSVSAGGAARAPPPEAGKEGVGGGGGRGRGEGTPPPPPCGGRAAPPPPLHAGVRLGSHVVFQHLHQTRFADAGLPAEEYHLPHTGGGLLPAPPQERDFFVPADQRRQAAYHGDIETGLHPTRL